MKLKPYNTIEHIQKVAENGGCSYWISVAKRYTSAGLRTQNILVDSYVKKHCSQCVLEGDTVRCGQKRASQYLKQLKLKEIKEL